METFTLHDLLRKRKNGFWLFVIELVFTLKNHVSGKQKAKNW